MRSVLLIGLVLFLGGCFDVTVTNNWTGSTGSGMAACTAFVATPTTTYPNYDYSKLFSVLAAGDSDVVQFDHKLNNINTGAYLWVECTLDDGVKTVEVSCAVADPDRRDFMHMTINADGSVSCIEGVSPPM